MLEDLLQRVARLAATVHEVAELDFNPAIVSAVGVEIVDARIRVAPLVQPEEHVRRLS